MSNFLNSLSPWNLLMNIGSLVFRKKNIALYDEHGGEILADSTIISCTVNDTSRLMEHPIESGATVADYKVFNPVTASIIVALPEYGFEGQFAEIYSVYKNSEYVILQTKTNVYKNLQVLSIPHEANIKNVSRPTITIQLKEALTVEAQFTQEKQLKNKANTKTKDEGHVQTEEKQSSSILKDLKDKVSSWFD